MNHKPIYINNFNKTDSTTPLWKWKTIDFQLRKPENKLPTVTAFFSESGRKLNEVVLGPGVGAGVGCGVGIGLGVVGGAGFGVSGWNQLSAVFGIGMGCGVGVGVGFGQGFGAGFSLESLKSRLSKKKSKSKRRVVV